MKILEKVPDNFNIDRDHYTYAGGRKLAEEDIGKIFVRVKTASNDFTFVPQLPMESEIKKCSVKLLAINSDGTLNIEDAFQSIYTIESIYNDNGWEEVPDFTNLDDQGLSITANFTKSLFPMMLPNLTPTGYNPSNHKITYQQTGRRLSENDYGEYFVRSQPVYYGSSGASDFSYGPPEPTKQSVQSYSFKLIRINEDGTLTLKKFGKSETTSGRADAHWIPSRQFFQIVPGKISYCNKSVYAPD